MMMVDDVGMHLLLQNQKQRINNIWMANPYGVQLILINFNLDINLSLWMRLPYGVQVILINLARSPLQTDALNAETPTAWKTSRCRAAVVPRCLSFACMWTCFKPLPNSRWCHTLSKTPRHLHRIYRRTNSSGGVDYLITWWSVVLDLDQTPHIVTFSFPHQRLDGNVGCLSS